MKKSYVTLRDIYYNNKSWFTDRPRKLSEKQVREITRKFGDILQEHNPTPKRFVNLDGKEMTWGEYLKYRNSLRN